MKDKRPSFQFYPGDFLSDHNVIGMSMEERGAYITLLCICWDQGHLPNDEKALARYLNGTSMDLSFVVGCFTEKDGVLVHKRLMEERQKQDDYKKRCSKGGKQSQQNQRDKKSLPSGLEVPCNTPSSSSSPTPSSTSLKDKIKTIVVFDEEFNKAFEEDWSNYPKPGGDKQKGKIAYKNTVGPDLKLRVAYQAKTEKYIASFNGRFKYAKNKDTWMRNWTNIEIMQIEDVSERTTFDKKRDRVKEWYDDPHTGNNQNQIGGGNVIKG